MRNKSNLLTPLLLASSMLFAYSSVSAQVIELVAQRDNIAKGELLELELVIDTDEFSLEQLDVEFELPYGFAFHGDDPDGVSVESSLSAGSSYAKLVAIEAPDQEWGEAGVSMREPKVFIANVSYREGADGPVRTRTARTVIRATTSVPSFYVSAMIGIALGLLTKILVKLPGRREGESVANFVRGQIAGVLTTFLIGWIVLMVAASGGVPVQGWHDALAFGATIGLVGDENLLSKLTPTGRA